MFILVTKKEENTDNITTKETQNEKKIKKIMIECIE